MKKRLAVLLIIIVSLFYISTSTLVKVNAADDGPTTSEVEDPTLQDAANELKSWWEDSMLPWILTAVAGASGSGIISLALAFLLKKSKKKLDNTIDDASTALSLSTEANNKLHDSSDALMNRVEDLINNRLEIFSNAIAVKIDSILNEKLEKYQIAAEDIIESRQRILALAETIVKVDDEVPDDENKD